MHVFVACIWHSRWGSQEPDGLPARLSTSLQPNDALVGCDALDLLAMPLLQDGILSRQRIGRASGGVEFPLLSEAGYRP